MNTVKPYNTNTTTTTTTAQRYKKQIQHRVKTLHKFTKQRHPLIHRQNTTESHYIRVTSAQQEHREGSRRRVSVRFTLRVSGETATCDGGTGHFSLNGDACVNGAGVCSQSVFAGEQQQQRERVEKEFALCCAHIFIYSI